MFLKDGTDSRILYSCPVATGRKGRRTPLRKFRVLRKIFKKPLWKDCDHPGRIFYYGQSGYPYGKLGIWIKLDKHGYYAMHTTSNPRSIGRYANHGCIRLKDDDAVWIYKVIPLGTSVKVVELLLQDLRDVIEENVINEARYASQGSSGKKASYYARGAKPE